jgi:hypothetical protein
MIKTLSGSAPKEHMVGYGNSRHDIDFLSIVGSPNPVAADSSLRRHALLHGWPTVFLQLPKHSLLSPSDPWVETSTGKARIN